jgi:hypothetical protein
MKATLALTVLLLALGGTVAKSDDSVRGTKLDVSKTEFAIVFGEDPDNTVDRVVTSGNCKMHRGKLTVRADGTASFNYEVSSSGSNDKWLSRFLFVQGNPTQTLTFVPSLRSRRPDGPPTVPVYLEGEIKEKFPNKTYTYTQPLLFERAIFDKVNGVWLLFKC